MKVTTFRELQRIRDDLENSINHINAILWDEQTKKEKKERKK